MFDLLKIFSGKQIINLAQYLGIALFIVFLSCQKEKDTSHPLITYLSPPENQIFSIYDTIPIEATITDDQTISYIRTRIVDEEFNPALPAHFRHPLTSSFHLIMDYPIEDAYLKSGNYYIEIRAEDGTNFKNQYQKIFIEEIPPELEKIIAITQKDIQKLEVLEIGPDNIATPMFEVSGDFASSALSTRYKQLYIAGTKLTNLLAFDLETYNNDWSLNPEPPFPIHAFDCLHYDQNLYCTFEYLMIYGYNNYGQVKLSTIISEGGIPSRPYKFRNLLLVDVQNSSAGKTYLGTYYTETGSEKQRLQINFQVVEFFEWDNEHVIIFANSSGSGVLKLYNPYENVISSISTLQGKIICAEKTDSNKFVIGTENQLYHFSYYPPVLNPVLPGKIAYRLRYDTLYHHLYMSCPDYIEKIIYPEMVYQSSIMLSDSILNFHLLYNK